jgi:hypothetical protein
MAVLSAVKKGEPQRIGRLFFACCRALDCFGKSLSPDKPVPLQCPGSLAVGSNYRVIPLDAEIRLRGPLNNGPEAKQLFATWFGDSERNGFASRNEASIKHANAILLYFRSLMRAMQQQATPQSLPVIAGIAGQLGQMQPGKPLNELEDWIRSNNQDWSLPVEEEKRAFPSGPPPMPASGKEPPVLEMAEVIDTPDPFGKRSLFLALSLLANLLLVAAVALLLALRLDGRAGTSGKMESRNTEASPRDPNDGKSDGPPRFDSAVLFSSHCVVFPTQGTIGEKVNASLADLFPGRITEARRGTAEQDRLLGQKLDEVTKTIPDPEQLKQLLIRLATDHGVRFKGFNAESGDGLEAVIRRGGVFTISGGREEHGTLLQSTAVDKILRKTDVPNQPEVRALLVNLRLAVAEYASLKDALSIIGDRPAFLVRIDPTAAGHEETRRKLLSRVDKPVYSSRPIPALFDAVDPTADTGSGSATYTLRLERRSFWRQAGLDDRKNVDSGSNTSNDRMKWQSFNAGQEIFWRPIPLTRKTGKTEAVASFDIAVVLESNMVIFRNQAIFVGESRAQVLNQGKKYITDYLKLPAREIEEAFTVKESGDQFTGVLNYSYLADLVSASPSCDDLKVLSKDEFDRLKGNEDKFTGGK